MKKPKYIWFSCFACMYLFSVLSVKVRFKVKPFDINLWLSFCAHSIGAWLAYVMLPPFLLGVLIAQIGNTSVGEVLHIFIYIVLYFGGVYAANRIFQWGHARKFLK